MARVPTEEEPRTTASDINMRLQEKQPFRTAVNKTNRIGKIQAEVETVQADYMGVVTMHVREEDLQPIRQALRPRCGHTFGMIIPRDMDGSPEDVGFPRAANRD